jgi:hypothetical protein
MPTPAAPTRPYIDRARKRSELLAAPETVLLLEAPAGMGKSILLAQLAEELGAGVHRSASAPPDSSLPVTVWDIPPGSIPAPLPEAFVSGERRIIVAKRPETMLPALDRAAVYGHVRRLGIAELLIGRDELRQAMPTRLAERAFQQSHGWPILLGRSGGGEDTLARFLASELLAPMRAGELAALAAWLDGARARSRPRSYCRCSIRSGRRCDMPSRRRSPRGPSIRSVPPNSRRPMPNKG